MSLLILDDDEVMLEILSGIIDSFNEPYQAFSNPELALEVFTDSPNKFTGGIIDYNLIHTTGIVVADKMHALNPDMNFIFCTATSDTYNRNLIEERGMWLAKPLNVHTSYALIRYFIEMCNGRLDVMNELQQTILNARNVSLEACSLIQELITNIEDKHLKRKAHAVIDMLEDISSPSTRVFEGGGKAALRLIK